jgi:hypothetical protein
MNRDYAAALDTAIQKGFWGPLARNNCTKFFTLKPNLHCDAMIPQVSLKKSFLTELLTGQAIKPHELKAIELQDCRSAPPAPGEPGQKLRLHGHATRKGYCDICGSAIKIMGNFIWLSQLHFGS